MSDQPNEFPQTVKQYRSVEFRLYPSRQQADTLLEWMRVCCWVYNLALEHRKKAYARRKQSVTKFDQSRLLTKWRSNISRLVAVPAQFQRDALDRVDKAFAGFFRRVKAGQKAGYPRFKSFRRYASLKQCMVGNYINGRYINVPKLGHIRARGIIHVQGKQKSLQVLHKADKWYARILIEAEAVVDEKPVNKVIGIDLGLESFAILDDGSKIDNPRFLKKASNKLRAASKSVSRKKRGSNRRKKAVIKLGRLYDRVQRKRRGFLHRVSRQIVGTYDLIGLEDLNVAKMAKGRFNKGIRDVGWSTFIRFVTYKAASAGKRVVLVDPAFTSQTCPRCENVKPKKISERVHNCTSCGLILERDHAAAQIVRDRAVRHVRGDLVRPSQEGNGL